MIRQLTIDDKELVLSFAYQREHENLFVIGSMNRYDNPFKENSFFGYFHNDALVGLATSFGRYSSFVVNAKDKKVIQELTDFAVKKECPIADVPCFKEYGEVVVQHLKTTHNREPKQIRQETVYTLKKDNFHDYSSGKESLLDEQDMDQVILLNREIEGEDLTKPIEEIERKRIDPKETFVLKVEGKVVSIADIHGTSKNYFQIGGVGTSPAHRGKGYAKQVVSFLCKTYFEKGLKTALLFARNDNFAAQKVYSSLGFKPTDEFIIAKY